MGVPRFTHPSPHSAGWRLVERYYALCEESRTHPPVHSQITLLSLCEALNLPSPLLAGRCPDDMAPWHSANHDAGPCVGPHWAGVGTVLLAGIGLHQLR